MVEETVIELRRNNPGLRWSRSLQRWEYSRSATGCRQKSVRSHRERWWGEIMIIFNCKLEAPALYFFLPAWNSIEHWKIGSKISRDVQKRYFCFLVLSADWNAFGPKECDGILIQVIWRTICFLTTAKRAINTLPRWSPSSLPYPTWSWREITRLRYGYLSTVLQ